PTLHLHSFPTRRSSDLYVEVAYLLESPHLVAGDRVATWEALRTLGDRLHERSLEREHANDETRQPLQSESLPRFETDPALRREQDRKSTRLNSSHLGIS